MPMMGSAPSGGGSELSFTDVIGMLKDEPSYQTKLREIGNRLNKIKATEKAVADINAKAEATKKFTADMAAKAEVQLVKARQLKEEADRQVADAVKRERDVAVQHEAFQKQAETELEGHRQHLRDAFIAREKEVAAKEQKLLADLKAFKVMQADEDTKAEAFKDWKKSKEAELAKKSAVLQGELDKTAQAKAESEKIRQQLQDKLEKIKAISVG